MVVVDSRRVPRVPRYSGACHEPHHFCLRGYHPLWPVFPDDSTSGSVGNSPALNRAGPTTPMDPKTHRFGLFRVRSPLLTKSLNCFLFLQVLRWFTSLSSLPKAYGFSSRILHFQRRGFPHSDISGSTPVCGSPKLFAAYHVLHRLPSPRHPPYALSSLIITCLWRSLYFLSVGSALGIASVRRLAAASLQPSGPPTPEFVEFAHQYSVVKDLKVRSIQLQVGSNG